MYRNLAYIPNQRVMRLFTWDEEGNRIETDCPYLIPKNLPEKPKNNRNEPINLNHIVSEIAMLMGKDEEILRKDTFKNTINFFTN